MTHSRARRAGICALTALIASAASPGVRAQDTRTSERTGPEAEPLTVEFADEPPSLAPQIAEPSTSRIAGTVTIGALAIEDPREFSGTVRPGWTPTTSPMAGLSLSHRPGEALDAAWVRRQFEEGGLIGRPVGLERVVAMTQLINRALIENGYINSGALIAGAPPRDGGTLTLRLIAGSLATGDDGTPGFSVDWGPQGPSGLDEDYAAARMSSALATPLNVIELEREFRLLAENPAIETLSADLQPGTRPGEARLALTVYPVSRASFYGGLANSRSPAIGGERFFLGGALRNLVQGGDILATEAGLTGGEYDWSVSYETPIVSDRVRMRLRGGENNAAVVDAQLKPLDITASDWQVEGSLVWRALAEPLSPGSESGAWKPARSLDLGIGFIHREALTTLLGVPFSFSPGAVDGRAQYSAMRLTADFISRNVDTVFAASLTATQGLDGTQSTLPGLISPEPDFQAYRGQVSYARRLTDGGLELRLRAAGQWASGILYAGERFSAGGARTVRGYRETLALADTGVLGSVELAQAFSLSPPAQRGRDFDLLRFSAALFADGALTANREGPPALPDELASAGVSLSWRPHSAIDTTLSYGEALVNVPLTGGTDLQDRGFAFVVVVWPLKILAN